MSRPETTVPTPRALARVAAVGVFACLAFASPAARADLPERSLHLGVYGGAHFVLDDWDLHERGNSQVRPKDSAVVGLRIGGHVLRWLVVEGGLGVVPFFSTSGGRNLALLYDVDALFTYPVGDWGPYLAIGGGGYSNVSGSHGDDSDYQLHYGVGIRGVLLGWLGLRLELRHVMTDGSEAEGGNIASNLLLISAIDFTVLGRGAPPPAADTDGDGIPDTGDLCPAVAGHRSAQGCPDRDGDGIVDSKDRCPDLRGNAKADGCPDRDGDGVLDPQDACPDEAGPKGYGGCPDTDGDGIIDKNDQCPKVKGTVDLKGCPPKPVVIPKDVVARFNGRLEGIVFRSGSAKILKKSFKVLDKAAATLKAWPTLRVRIEGHTDDRGKKANNLRLSRKRAESVRTYLIQRGVAAERLVAEGHGPNRPVVPNKTAAGRAKNRRIELRIIPAEKP